MEKFDFFQVTSKIVLIVTSLLLFVNIFSVISYYTIISYSSANQNNEYQVFYVNKPFTENTTITAHCFGSSVYVVCSVNYENSSLLENPKLCHFSDKIDPFWATESLKSLTNLKSTLFYQDKPLVVAMENDRGIVGWLEKNVNNIYRLRMKNINFIDCKISETIVVLGQRIHEKYQAFINVESRRNGYDVVVGNYNACRGKMCKIHVNANGKIAGDFNEWFGQTKIEVKCEKWDLLPAFNEENVSISKKILIYHMLTVANSSILQENWSILDIEYGNNYRGKVLDSLILISLVEIGINKILYS